MRYPAILFAFLVLISEAFLPAEDLTPEIQQQVLLDQSYVTGLSTRGTTGLIMTARTESLFKGGWMRGINGFGSRMNVNDADIRDFGISVSWAMGLAEEVVWDKFRNLEISANIPILMRNNDEETITGIGEPTVSAKFQVLDEDPMHPAIPSVSLLGSVMLPLARREFETFDTMGLEAGVIVGKTVDNSFDMTSFRVYGELRMVYKDFENDADIFIRGNLGMAFSLAEYSDYYLILEYGLVGKSDKLHENGDIYIVGVQYLKDEFNITAAYKTRFYDFIEEYERSVFLMYDIKF